MILRFSYNSRLTSLISEFTLDEKKNPFHTKYNYI